MVKKSIIELMNDLKNSIDRQVKPIQTHSCSERKSFISEYQCPNGHETCIKCTEGCRGCSLYNSMEYTEETLKDKRSESTLLNLSKARVLKAVLQNNHGFRWCYIQKITSKSIVIIKDEDTVEVYDRKTGLLRTLAKSEDQALSLSNIHFSYIITDIVEDFLRYNNISIWDGHWRAFSKFYKECPENLLTYNFLKVQKCLIQPDGVLTAGCDYDEWFKEQEVSIIPLYHYHNVFEK